MVDELPFSSFLAGDSEEYNRFVARPRSVEEIRYVTPYLKEGISLLDLGSGPGTLSALLAEAIAPGQLYGIDIDPSQVEAATSYVRDRGITNASFQTAHVFDIPFEDGLFDLVHCGDILIYVTDTKAALAEIRRVLKPGGLLASRDVLLDSSFLHPDSGGYLKAALESYRDLVEADDGHPDLFRELPGILLEAGFGDVRLSNSSDIYRSDEDKALLYGLGIGWFFTPLIQDPAQNYGAANEGLFKRISEYLDVWRNDPSSFACFFFGEVVARRL